MDEIKDGSEKILREHNKDSLHNASVGSILEELFKRCTADGLTGYTSVVGIFSIYSKET